MQIDSELFDSDTESDTDENPEILAKKNNAQDEDCVWEEKWSARLQHKLDEVIHDVKVSKSDISLKLMVRNATS